MVGKLRGGVLALQGDFEAHAAVLVRRRVRVSYVRQASDLEGLDVVFLPGGESSAMLRLLSPELEYALVSRIRSGLAVFATCAGAILLARKVTSPEQRSLQLIDIDVKRNAYGRQLDSFVEPELQWTEAGRAAVADLGIEVKPVEGVFIRAPKIERVGPDVETLLRCGGDPVLVAAGKIFAATFHPELGAGSEVIYELFLERAAK